MTDTQKKCSDQNRQSPALRPWLGGTTLRRVLLACCATAGCDGLVEQPEQPGIEPMPTRSTVVEANALTAAPEAHSGIASNGIKLNGINLNGINLNGINLNGINLNGINLN